MNNKEIKIAGVSSIVTLVGGIVGGWLFLDSYFAHASDVEQLEQRTVQTLETYQKTQVVNQLNRISIKEQLGALSKYDKILKDQLELELKVLTEKK